MQDRPQKDKTDPWMIVTELFCTEAEFFGSVSMLCSVLDMTKLKKNKMAKKLEEFKQYLQLYYDISDNESSNNRLRFREINFRNLDVKDKNNIKKSTNYLKNEFDEDFDLALNTILEIIKSRISNYHFNYLYYMAMRDDIASLEEELKPHIVLPENQSLENITIKGVQHYLRYSLQLIELIKLNTNNETTDQNNETTAKLQELNSQIEQFTKAADSLILMKFFAYLVSYKNKNSTDYLKRAKHFKLLLKDLIKTRDPQIIIEKYKNDIKEFSFMSFSNRYAKLLHELLCELKSNPDQLLKQVINFKEALRSIPHFWDKKMQLGETAEKGWSILEKQGDQTYTSPASIPSISIFSTAHLSLNPSNIQEKKSEHEEKGKKNRKST